MPVFRHSYWLRSLSFAAAVRFRIHREIGGELAQLQLDLVRNVASANDVNKLKSVLEKALDEIQAARSQEGNLPVGQWKSLKLLRNAPISNVVAVIGGGLSGLTASLRLLEKGRRVLLIEKQPFMGGNSAKASSGINGCTTEKQKQFRYQR